MALPRRRYLHSIEFRDLGIARRPIVGEDASGERRVRGWMYVGMPRILPEMERCVVFMHDLDGERGGTAFLISRAWDSRPNERHCYLVTTAHLLPDYPVAIPPYQGAPALTTNVTDWLCYRDDEYDLAVADVTEVLEEKNIPEDTLTMIAQEMFATKKGMQEVDVGIGDEVCMVGLFGDEEGTHNEPVGRFGALAALARDEIKIAASEGKPQPSHLVDMRSRDGFSGSPAFIYRTPVTNLESITHSKYAWNLDTRKDLFLALLGVHRGQFRETTTVRNVLDAQAASLKGAALEIDSAMTTVVPAWEIATLLDHEDFQDMRKQREDAYKPPKGKTVKLESKRKRPEPEVNPNHREDFKRLLGAAVRPPKSSD